MGVMKKGDIPRLAVSVSICLSAGLLGSFFTKPHISTWYAGLVKPSFSPPAWVFAPVWTALYVMMGISFFLVWRKGLEDPGVKSALGLFMAQLFFNVLWSYLFFALRSPLSGMLDIMTLWFFILMTIIGFLKVSRTAALMLLPYIAWVSFALILNISVWGLNP